MLNHHTAAPLYNLVVKPLTFARSKLMSKGVEWTKENVAKVENQMNSLPALNLVTDLISHSFSYLLLLKLHDDRTDSSSQSKTIRPVRLETLALLGPSPLPVAIYFFLFRLQWFGFSPPQFFFAEGRYGAL